LFVCFILITNFRHYDVRFSFETIFGLLKNTFPIGRLLEKVFKRVSANSNPNLNPNLKPNPKAQKRFRKNEMKSFSGNCPADTHKNTLVIVLMDQ